MCRPRPCQCGACVRSNSVAISFIFELDAIFYESLVSPEGKRHYQERAPQLPPHLDATPASEDFAFRWTLLFVIPDCVIMAYQYAVYTFFDPGFGPWLNNYYAVAWRVDVL